MDDVQLKAWIEKELVRVRKQIPRYEEYTKSGNGELRIGGESFLRKYRRDERVLTLALQQLNAGAPPPL